MYCIQPSQLGKLAIFLNKPEKRMKGSIKEGVKVFTDLASVTKVPKTNPKDAPANPMR